MGEKLRAELKQGKPFSSLAEEAILNLERTADCFRREFQKALKPYGITQTQYNALRILRGAQPKGLTCSELGERLVSGDPDITRLLERMARLSLITRYRAAADKRVMMTEIAPAGLELLVSLVPILDQYIQRSLAHMDRDAQETLIDLLEDARAPYTRQADAPTDSPEIRICGELAS
jgi:DNA-binding MarR family transcriptional regulator